MAPHRLSLSLRVLIALWLTSLSLACDDQPQEPYPLKVTAAALKTSGSGPPVLWLEVENISDRGVDGWSFSYTPRDDLGTPLARRYFISEHDDGYTDAREFRSSDDIAPGDRFEVSLPLAEDPETTRVEIVWGLARHERSDDLIRCDEGAPRCELRLLAEPW